MLDPGDAQSGPYKVNSLVITPDVDPIAGLPWVNSPANGSSMATWPHAFMARVKNRA